VRDSILNEGFDVLPFWERLKLGVANPLAYIASTTNWGKAKTA